MAGERIEYDAPSALYKLLTDKLNIRPGDAGGSRWGRVLDLGVGTGLNGPLYAGESKGHTQHQTAHSIQCPVPTDRLAPCAPPQVTKLEQTAAKEERRRKLKAYGWLVGAILVWGGLGLLWLSGSETCAHTAPSVYRLALLLSLVYALFVSLLALLLLALAVDFCLSGKLRMVVILEQ